MIRLRLGTLAVRIHPALFVMLVLSALGGAAAETAVLILSLILHELGHAAAARMLKIRVVELELMPFGGAARLENAWALRPGQMALVALAGPLVSAIAMIVPMVLFRAGVMPVGIASTLARVNGYLLFFNLLPVLPLDGGRVLCGLLGRRMGQARAARIGVILGRALAGMMIALAVLGAFLLGKLNLSLVMLAAFLIASGARERLAASGASLLSLIDRQSELAGEGALPVKWLAASTDTELRKTIARFSPRALHRVAVYDEDLRFAGVLEEGELLKAALDDANMVIGKLIKA